MLCLGVVSYCADKLLMTIDKQRMFERFKMLNPLTCTSDLNEDAYQFIVSCNEIFQKL